MVSNFRCSSFKNKVLYIVTIITMLVISFVMAQP